MNSNTERRLTSEYKIINWYIRLHRFFSCKSKAEHIAELIKNFDQQDFHLTKDFEIYFNRQKYRFQFIKSYKSLKSIWKKHKQILCKKNFIKIKKKDNKRINSLANAWDCIFVSYTFRVSVK